MNGIVFDLKRFATHDGPGIRTTVFFKGCPLRCQWCHNPESIHPDPEEIILYDKKKCLDLSSSISIRKIGREISALELFNEIKKDQVFFSESKGGITFSGGEPLFQTDFLLELLVLCKNEHIHTLVDTSGFSSFSNFLKINSYIDLYLYDLKLIDKEQHLQYTQTDNSLILDNLIKLSKIAKKIIIRVPLIPNISDTDKNLKEIVAFLKDLKEIEEIHLLPFNRLYESKCEKFRINNKLKGLQKQDSEKLLKLKALVELSNFKVSIGG